MTTGGLLILLLIVLIALSFMNLGFNARWGYTPTAFLGALLILFMILDLLGAI